MGDRRPNVRFARWIDRRGERVDVGEASRLGKDCREVGKSSPGPQAERPLEGGARFFGATELSEDAAAVVLGFGERGVERERTFVEGQGFDEGSPFCELRTLCVERL